MNTHLDFEKKFHSPNPYMGGYRAGWNDSLDELMRKIPDIFTYAELKILINSIKLA